MASKTQYPLVDVLSILGITIQDLTDMTGLNGNSVRRAVMGGNVRTNYTVAEAIAEALCMEMDEIIWPSGLTHLGRRAFTGRPMTKRRPPENEQPRCSNPACNMILPKSLICACA